MSGKSDIPLKDRLPEPVKQFLIRLGISTLGAGLGTLRWVYRMADGGVRFAKKQGFNFDRELPPAISRIFATRGLPDDGPGVTDFLLLTSENPASAGDVKASIIIPVFNKAELTFRCLRSLFREVDLTENEIIIIDNGSGDETPELLDRLGGQVRTIRNETNTGFVEACNQGAAAARGKYLVFLNNDTIVQPGWLDALVNTAESDPRAGAVGSMLIYPDGRLQEAGGIVFSDATPNAYGSRENPDELRFNFVREVDYCSGASLLIGRELFDRVGGFDMRFAPAYYEDTDLCMSVRAAGFKVVYQPASRVVHFEGSTAGTSTQSGYKRFQEVNKHKFFDKWRDVLQREHLPNSRDNVREASNRKKGKRIIVCFNQIPKPDEDSGSQRLFSILRSLTEHNRVSLVYVHLRKNDAKYERQLGSIGVEAVWVVDFVERFRGDSCDVAILAYPKVGDLMLPKVRRMFPKAHIIYDTVDIHFIRLQREFELTGDKKFQRMANDFRRSETRLAREADQLWCITEDDSEFLKGAVPKANIELVPNMHELKGRGKPFAERSGLMFIGSFYHRPNLDAIDYFIDEIFPRILAEIPDVVFRIVGSNPPPEIFARGSANVVVEGFVPDADPIFESARLFVAPLRYGAGMKGKIGQAMSYGLPTVTTSIGAEGTGMADGRDVLIADDPAAFADAVIRAYRSEELWQHLSDNSYKFVAENLSAAVVGAKVNRLVEAVAGEQRQLEP